MPNYCSNSVKLTGNPLHMTKIVRLLEGELSLFDFNKLMPMPEILHKYTIGFRTIDGQEHQIWREEEDGNAVALTSEERLGIKATDATDWHDWRCRNWGTKWPAGDIERQWEEGSNSAYYKFETAWCPPQGIVKFLVELFKEKYRSISLQWVYEDWMHGAYCGMYLLRPNGTFMNIEDELYMDQEYNVDWPSWLTEWFDTEWEMVRQQRADT